MRASRFVFFVDAFLSSGRASGAQQDATWFSVLHSTDRQQWADASRVVCALDAFRFGVLFSAPKRLLKTRNKGLKWQLIAREVDGWATDAVVDSGALEVNLIEDTELYIHRFKTDEEQKQTLQCEFDQEFCKPKLVGIRLPDVAVGGEEPSTLQRGHRLELEFESSTNTPDVSTKEQIDDIVVFTEYIGDDLEGAWASNGRVMVIKILDISADNVKPVEDLMQGLLRTSILVVENSEDGDYDNKVLASFEGIQSLRIEPVGRFSIRVNVHGAKPIWSPSFLIERCDASHVVTYSGSTIPDEDDIRLTAPSFAIEGVMSHGGKEGFVLPHDSIQMQTPGSWSMSFWAFLTQDSIGSFRTLFFNGDGQHQQRTPSAWWKPNERRLVLRVSTNTSADVGIDSTAELPLNRWVHLGFTFVNCSQTSNDTQALLLDPCPDANKGDEDWSYSILFYVNGILDTKARFRDPVVANTGPLHIGKGPWTDGMQGFTSNLKVFPVAITPDMHREYYFLEIVAHKNFDELNCKHSASISEHTEATTFPSTQISYLSQQFRCRHDGNALSQELWDNNFPKDDGFVGFQTSAYNLAVAARDTCQLNAWDLLVEAANLGHPTACRDIGDSYLYGKYKTGNCGPEHSVQQNLTLAKRYLEKALVGGELGVGKSLVILQDMINCEMLDEDTRHFTLGLLHLSAACGDKEVFAMLGHRYRQLIPESRVAIEIATYHYYHAAVEASIAYHELGKQPLHEMARLYDSFQRDLTIGERGNDDELIQFQKMNADKGDVSAMAAMGDLYYWGSHGVPRNHAQAYEYFERAAQAGDVRSQSAVAGMLLKGEGIPQDNVTAIKWYEKAVEQNHTRALNGLGFIHFHGSGGVPENKTLALEYFERAAANEEDGDSIFNAGYCYASGLGTSVNVSRAMQFYDVAARKFGHFDAIFEMGKLLARGVSGSVSRDIEKALEYLKAASEGGQWGKTMRKGFDLYVDGEFARAAALYHEARNLGYPIATSNLAFLYDQRLLEPGDNVSECQALHYLTLASEENGDQEPLVRIGDYHYYGLARLPRNSMTAIRWYSRASAEGIAAGAYNVGHMYEFGDGVKTNLVRARRYFDRVLELSSGSTEVHVAIRFALVRLWLRSWLEATPFNDFITSRNPILGSAGTNESTTDSLLAFDAATDFFKSKLYAIASTAAIICITIGFWYLHSVR